MGRRRGKVDGWHKGMENKREKNKSIRKRGRETWGGGETEKKTIFPTWITHTVAMVMLTAAPLCISLSSGRCLATGGGQEGGNRGERLKTWGNSPGEGKLKRWKRLEGYFWTHLLNDDEQQINSHTDTQYSVTFTSEACVNKCLLLTRSHWWQCSCYSECYLSPPGAKKGSKSYPNITWHGKLPQTVRQGDQNRFKRVVGGALFTGIPQIFWSQEWGWWAENP